MALFGKSLLAYVAALVVSGTALCQEPFQEGVKLLRLGQKTEALAKFQEVLATDPSNEKALELYRAVDQDVWFMLLSEQGEIQKIAQSILERAKLENATRSRDAATIDTLVAAACTKGNSYDERRQAVLRLAADHGEFAVPALVARLANADDVDGQVLAIYTLQQIGHQAVLPLIAALGSSNGMVRLNAAAALTHIGDVRAVPAMASLAEADSQENVREVAKAFLGKHKVSGKAAELHIAQARQYLLEGIGQGAFSDVVWTLADDKLVATDTPALVYQTELAKGCAYEALRVDPASKAAKVMVAAANLAQSQIISASTGDEAAALAPRAENCRIAALTTGTENLRAALEAGLSDGMVPVSVGAIHALAISEDRDSVASSALLKALAHGDSRISYPAATALVQICNGVNVPNNDLVVEKLAMAVQEESVRAIQVIDPSAEAKRAAEQASSNRGTYVTQDASGRAGVESVLNNPNVDVVVINEILPDRLPEDVITVIKRDPRLSAVKIVVIAKDVEAAKTRFGDSIAGAIQGPLSGDALNASVTEVLADVPIEPRNARAETVAKAASESLFAMASAKSNIAASLSSLAAQLNRADAIAIPAAKALALTGTEKELGALLAAVKGSGSTELRAASAAAIGGILGRGAKASAEVLSGLGEVVHSDADVSVRTAAAAALGKAKLADGDQSNVIRSTQTLGAKKAEG